MIIEEKTDKTCAINKEKTDKTCVIDKEKTDKNTDILVVKTAQMRYTTLNSLLGGFV